MSETAQRNPAYQFPANGAAGSPLRNVETARRGPAPPPRSVSAPIRVLFVHTSLPGGDRSLLNVLRNLDPDRFRSSLFLLKPECVNSEEIADRTELIMGNNRPGRIRYGLPVTLRTLLKVAAGHDILVGALELDSTYLAWMAGRITGKPVIGWVRTTLDGYLQYKQRWHKLLLRAIYPRLDRTVFVNEHAASSTRRIVRLDPSRVNVIANSLDPQAVEVRQRTAASWSVPVGDRPIVMAVGRLNPEKGFDLLIRAHQRLRQAGLEHLLVILGKGPLREELAALAGQLNVADSVIMPGYFVNPYSAMKQAAVFALSSHVEGFPSVLLEALYLGSPIVASNCPSGPAEILDGGRYGLLVPPGDERALSAAIGSLLTDPDRRRSMSEAGRIRVQEFYAANIALRWQSMFDELLCLRA